MASVPIIDLGPWFSGTDQSGVSNRHRVLPPQAEVPDEDLISLVCFYEADRLDSITVG